DALRNYDTAFSLQPTGELAARADLLYKRGLTRRSLSRRWDEALADWREATGIYERLGDKQTAGRIFAAMVERLLWGLRYEDAAELIQRGLALLGKRESVDRCRLLAWTGLTLSVAGYYSGGDTVLRRALAIAERIGDANVLGSAQLGTAVHHFCYAQMREAAECGVKGTDLLRRAGNLWDLTQGSIFVGYALLDVGRLDESLNLLREGGLLAKRLGSSASSYEFYLALLREGDIDACENHGRAGLERAQAGEDHASTWTDVAVLGTAQFWRGRWREALD